MKNFKLFTLFFLIISFLSFDVYLKAVPKSSKKIKSSKATSGEVVTFRGGITARVPKQVKLTKEEKEGYTKDDIKKIQEARRVEVDKFTEMQKQVSEIEWLEDKLGKKREDLQKASDKKKGKVEKEIEGLSLKLKTAEEGWNELVGETKRLREDEMIRKEIEEMPKGFRATLTEQVKSKRLAEAEEAGYKATERLKELAKQIQKTEEERIKKEEGTKEFVMTKEEAVNFANRLKASAVSSDEVRNFFRLQEEVTVGKYELKDIESEIKELSVENERLSREMTPAKKLYEGFLKAHGDLRGKDLEDLTNEEKKILNNLDEYEADYDRTLKRYQNNDFRLYELKTKQNQILDKQMETEEELGTQKDILISRLGEIPGGDSERNLESFTYAQSGIQPKDLEEIYDGSNKIKQLNRESEGLQRDIETLNLKISADPGNENLKKERDGVTKNIATNKEEIRGLEDKIVSSLERIGKKVFDIRDDVRKLKTKAARKLIKKYGLEDRLSAYAKSAAKLNELNTKFIKAREALEKSQEDLQTQIEKNRANIKLTSSELQKEDLDDDTQKRLNDRWEVLDSANKKLTKQLSDVETQLEDISKVDLSDEFYYSVAKEVMNEERKKIEDKLGEKAKLNEKEIDDVLRSSFEVKKEAKQRRINDFVAKNKTKLAGAGFLAAFTGAGALGFAGLAAGSVAVTAGLAAGTEALAGGGAGTTFGGDEYEEEEYEFGDYDYEAYYGEFSGEY